MIDLIKRMLVGGGLLTTWAVTRLLLLVLYPLCVGLIVAIFAERVLYQMLEEKDYKKSSSASESAKPKEMDGGG